MEIVSTGQWLPGDANVQTIKGKPHGARVTVLLEHMQPGTGAASPYAPPW